MKVKDEVSAGGVVYKKVGEKILWLICQHSQHKGWVFPKGLIGDQTKGESINEAALREVEEEGGVKTKIVNKDPIKIEYQYQWNKSPHGGTKGKAILINKTVYYFLMEYISGDPKNHDWEMSDAKFVTEDEIKKTLTFSSDKEAFEKILGLFKEM